MTGTYECPQCHQPVAYEVVVIVPENGGELDFDWSLAEQMITAHRRSHLVGAA